MTSRVVSSRLLASMRTLGIGSLAPATAMSAASTGIPSAANAAVDANSASLFKSLIFHQARAFARETRRAESVAETGDSPASVSVSLSDVPQHPPRPWTPTRLLNKRKTLPKRMGHLLSVLEKEKEDEARAGGSYPDFKAGDHIELKLSIPQNKGRETVFKGICIAKRNRGWRTSFTLRNFIGNNGGIERSFPLFSPHIKEYKVLREGKRVRRSKLYYLRNVQPKVYRI